MLLRPANGRYVLRAAFWPAREDAVVRAGGADGDGNALPGDPAGLSFVERSTRWRRRRPTRRGAHRPRRSPRTIRCSPAMRAPGSIGSITEVGVGGEAMLLTERGRGCRLVGSIAAGIAAV